MKQQKRSEQSLQTLGALMYQRRTDKNWSQTILADFVGVQRASISDWERGRRDIPFTKFIEICRILNINTHDVIDNIKPTRKLPEDFSPIIDYPNYLINRQGKIYSKLTHKLLKPRNCDGYLRVGLRKNNKTVELLVHRLVGINFIPNIFNKDQINHKDGNKHNNHVDNLEWCTTQENTEHYHTKLK